MMQSGRLSEYRITVKHFKMNMFTL